MCCQQVACERGAVAPVWPSSRWANSDRQASACLIQGHELEDCFAEDMWPKLRWHAAHQQWPPKHVHRYVVIHCHPSPVIHDKKSHMILARGCQCWLAWAALRMNQLPQQLFGGQSALQHNDCLGGQPVNCHQDMVCRECGAERLTDCLISHLLLGHELAHP